jgi:hypothetical protein
MWNIWGRGEVHTGFGRETWGKAHFVNLGIHGRQILKWILKRSAVRVWFDLAQDMGKWQALVNTVLNLQLPQNVGNLFTSWKIIIFLKRTLLRGVRLCVHANDNYILSPPPSAFTVPVISVLITVCSCTHAHELVKFSPIFPLLLQVEWCYTNWVLQLCIIFTIYIHPVVFLLLLL